MTSPSLSRYLEVHDLVYGYPKATRPALNQLNMQISVPGIYGVLGPNGSGKSTLFRALSGQLAANGQIRICGKLHSDFLRTQRARMGVCFQWPALDPQLTVLENLKIHAALYGFSASDVAILVDQRLERWGLSERRNQLVKTLSGGLQRRVELIKVLLTDPQLLLLDEPTTGLDPVMRREFWRAIDELRHKIPVIVATHLFEEAELCDRLFFLHQGKVVAEGTPSELQDRFEHQHLNLEFHQSSDRDVYATKFSQMGNVSTAGDFALSMRDPDPGVWAELVKNLSCLRRMEWGQSHLGLVFEEVTGDSLERKS